MRMAKTHISLCRNLSNGQLNLQDNSMILHFLILHYTTNNNIVNILLNLSMLYIEPISYHVVSKHVSTDLNESRYSSVDRQQRYKCSTNNIYDTSIDSRLRCTGSVDSTGSISYTCNKEPVLCQCERQRCRSVSALMQSDQGL